MRSYDAECPVCGTRNSGLFLEETEGWMECQACRSIVNVRGKAVPCPSFDPGKPTKKKVCTWYTVSCNGIRKESITF